MIQNKVQTNNLRKLYETFFDPESEHCLTTESNITIWQELEWANVISERDSTFIQSLMYEIGGKLYEALHKFDTERLKEHNKTTVKK